MSAAKCCDVCDKFYKDEKLDPKFKYQEGRPIYQIEIRSFGLSDELDLCPECGEKLRDFLGRERTCLK